VAENSRNYLVQYFSSIEMLGKLSYYSNIVYAKFKEVLAAYACVLCQVRLSSSLTFKASQNFVSQPHNSIINAKGVGIRSSEIIASAIQSLIAALQIQPP
jgi:hypothetical protein